MYFYPRRDFRRSRRNFKKKMRYAYELRQNATPAELALRNLLITRVKAGGVFYTQEVVRGYIIDAYYPGLRLGIECDDIIHETQQEEDAKRDKSLGRYGIKIMRFPNEAVLDYPEKVAEIIQKVVDHRREILQSQIVTGEKEP